MFSKLKYRLLNSADENQQVLPTSAPPPLHPPASPPPPIMTPMAESSSEHRASVVSLVKPPIYRIETSINPLQTIGQLKARRASIYDLQYVLLFFVGVFCLFVADDPPIVVKIIVSLLLLIGLFIPITSQILLPALPIFAWLLLFTSCQFIPSEWRPPIRVSVLPTLETALFGANLSEILSSTLNSVLDILAWLPYGVMHYGGPFVSAGLIFLFGSPGSLPVFARSFGYMNLIGVTTQLMFPCAPPWYEFANGWQPANYGMSGSPGGLARVDKIFGINLYSNAFGASPLVFGAFPSLHSGFSVLECLFLSHVFPRLSPLFIFYVMWIWWSTMYLTHHYFIDLIGGALLAITVFLIAKWNFLPSSQKGKNSRWQYEYIELTDINADAVRNMMRRQQRRARMSSSSTLHRPLYSKGDDDVDSLDDIDEFDPNLDEYNPDLDDTLTPLATSPSDLSNHYSSTGLVRSPQSPLSQPSGAASPPTAIDPSNMGFTDATAADYFNQPTAKDREEDLYQADFNDPHNTSFEEDPNNPYQDYYDTDRGAHGTQAKQESENSPYH
ncbi:uncharacterized protein V1516DRAFT_371751 [Lipomyces oligophaga]|uniref:uncharacterized protein n=1 Tax=Lipomyces oligophaga TaxID=45792 RepID=UPI0034CD73E8